MARRRRKTYRQVAASRRNIKKAQIASARSRRNRKLAIGVGTGVAVLGGGYAAHKISGSTLGITRKSNVSAMTGKSLGNGMRLSRGRTTVLTIGHGSMRTQMSYTLGRNARKISKRKLPNVDRDSIPLYNPKSGGRGWPHVSSDLARKINGRLREQGGLE